MSASIHRGGRPAKIAAVATINNATSSSSSASGGIEITPRHQGGPSSHTTPIVRPSTAPLKRKDAPPVTASPVVASSPTPSVSIASITANGATAGGRGGHQNKKFRPRSAGPTATTSMPSESGNIGQHQNGSRGGGRGGRGGGRGRRGRGGRGGSNGTNHHNGNGSSVSSAAINEGGDAMDENDDAEPDAAPVAVASTSGRGSESKGEVKEGKLAFMTDEPFSSLKPSLSASTLKALTDTLGYIYMTRVQAAAMPTIITGSDVLARARTGTGKTLGFLIPSVEVLMKTKSDGKSVGLLCISPTRELAQQIAEEAKNLTKFNGFGVQVILGGTNMGAEQKRFKSQRVDILVATPGRLKDHLQTTPGFQALCASLRVLVLDEADQLLEMGFRHDIEAILKMLPSGRGGGTKGAASSTRQTLLFSATVPKEVHEIAKAAMHAEFKFIDAMDDDGDATNNQVIQHYLLTPLHLQIHVIYELIVNARKVPNYKIMVFFTTARLTQYMAALFNKAGIPVLEIHSRKPQGYRTKVSNQFREGSNMVLFSSDVSARGVDYPDVTFILQVGLTERKQYIHRLGRTARAGKEGSGLLLLCNFEKFFLRELNDLPITEAVDDTPLVKALRRDSKTAPSLSPTSPMVRTLANVENDSELKERAQQAYQAWLGFYNTNARAIGWSKEELVIQANEWSSLCGLRSIPPLQKKTIGMMNLKGVPGLVIDDQPRHGGGGRGGGRGGARGGRGGGGQRGDANGNGGVDGGSSSSGQRGGSRGGRGRGGGGRGRGGQRGGSRGGAGGSRPQSAM